MIRIFTIEDYEEAVSLWKSMPGIGLRSIDDSKEGIARFLERNPATNFVAVEDGRIAGTILSGHDGRRGYIYHTCVEEKYRQKSIGRKLLEHVADSMKKEQITKLALVCFMQNEPGNGFWNSLGWTLRTDINYYNLDLIENN